MRTSGIAASRCAASVAWIVPRLSFRESLVRASGSIASNGGETQPLIEALGIDGFKLPGKAPWPGASGGPGKARHAGDGHEKRVASMRDSARTIEPAPPGLKLYANGLGCQFEFLLWVVYGLCATVANSLIVRVSHRLNRPNKPMEWRYGYVVLPPKWIIEQDDQRHDEADQGAKQRHHRHMHP